MICNNSNEIDQIDKLNNDLVWEQDGYFVAVYQMDSDGFVILKNANVIYRRIYHIKEEDIGSRLQDIMSDELEKNIRNLFEMYVISGKRCTLKYIREIEIDGEITFWRVNSTFANGYISNVGQRMYDINLSKDGGNAILDGISALFRRMGDGKFQVVSWSEHIPNVIKDTWVLNRLVGAQQCKFFDSKRLNRMLEKCYLNNHMIHYRDIIHTEADFMNVSVVMYPMIHEQSKNVLMYIKVLGEGKREEYKTNLKKYEKRFLGDLDEYFYSDCFAMGLYEEKQNQIYQRGISNSCLQKVLEKGGITDDHILSSELFKKCIRTCIIVRGYLQVKNRLELPEKYFIQLIPMLNENHVVRVLLLLDPNSVQALENNEMLLTLTKREREILYYVAEGDTNRYISLKLNIAEGTVKRIISNGYKKLGINSRIELAKLFHTEE